MSVCASYIFGLNKQNIKEKEQYAWIKGANISNHTIIVAWGTCYNAKVRAITNGKTKMKVNLVNFLLCSKNTFSVFLFCYIINLHWHASNSFCFSQEPKPNTPQLPILPISQQPKMLILQITLCRNRLHNRYIKSLQAIKPLVVFSFLLYFLRYLSVFFPILFL